MHTGEGAGKGEGEVGYYLKLENTNVSTVGKLTAVVTVGSGFCKSTIHTWFSITELGQCCSG